LQIKKSRVCNSSLTVCGAAFARRSRDVFATFSRRFRGYKSALPARGFRGQFLNRPIAPLPHWPPKPFPNWVTSPHELFPSRAGLSPPQAPKTLRDTLLPDQGNAPLSPIHREISQQPPRPPSSVPRPPSSVLRPPSSVIRHPSSAIRHPPSAIRWQYHRARGWWKKDFHRLPFKADETLPSWCR